MFSDSDCTYARNEIYTSTLRHGRPAVFVHDTKYVRRIYLLNGLYLSGFLNNFYSFRRLLRTFAPEQWRSRYA